MTLDVICEVEVASWHLMLVQHLIVTIDYDIVVIWSQVLATQGISQLVGSPRNMTSEDNKIPCCSTQPQLGSTLQEEGVLAPAGF